ncbi:hypothetical protein [Aurantiacibacter poecillastricola]|uniref:hypothetical protein n=1 Tax=Aurantiacibacter poecillastricola TaxID=3064385 RepID=UPI00273D1DB1|nr:hypothetical protein [Aurantiacibacter sp. 219JJ12-13]MDP5260728.1 hypothetical protein [Aurantiacibacter sp. 219JJ12-13]
MIVRVVIIGFAAIVAVLAVFVQLDRQSIMSPELAPLVPAPFAANASAIRSVAALRAGDSAEGLEQARQLVRLRPLPAGSLTTYSIAAAAAGQEDSALAALTAASRRGWREPLSQLASGSAALEQGQHGIAAQRVVALLASEKLRDQALELLSELVGTSEGRAQFAERMSQFGRWQTNALLPAADVVDPDDWAVTVALALEKGADLDCERVKRLEQKYLREGQEAAARILSEQDCPAN